MQPNESSAASSSREVESANDRYAIEHPHGDWHVASAASVRLWLLDKLAGLWVWMKFR